MPTDSSARAVPADSPDRAVPADDQLCFAGVRELSGLIASRQLSARELLQAHLARIERINPRVNAIVTLDPEGAARLAGEADDRLLTHGPSGPLHGLPAAFKDTHATAGMRTTYGSPIHARNVPDADDLVVARIKAAGAVGLGKTNVPEFAAGSHTVNPVFGLTHNPYALNRSAGGSSGGAAAALACGLVPVAEGSDLGGSLRNPASFCNVVGFRPSAGRVPEWPRTGFWDAMGTAGPMGCTVDDVAVLLSVLAGPEPLVPGCLPEPGRVFGAPLDSDPRGLRVAISPDLGGSVPVEASVAAVVAAQARVFEDLGCVVEPDCLDFAGAEEAFRTLRAWKFAAGFAELYATRPADLKASLRWNIEVGMGLSGADVARADALRMALHRRTIEFFSRFDALVLPTSQVPPFDAALEYPTEVAGIAQETYLDWMRSCYFVTVTGAPALSVPAGFTDSGLPVGIQLVGRPGSDLALLRLGHAFEQATLVGRRRPPLT